MDETLEKAHDRVQAICEKIRNETLDPARAEAEGIIERARKEAEKIRDSALHEAEKTIRDAKRKLEEEKQIFRSSLEQASQQTIETVKQKVEKALFNPALDAWLSSQLSSPQASAKLVEAIVKALDKDGIKTNLQVRIAENLSPDTVLAPMGKEIQERLKKGSVEVADIAGGVQVRLEGKHVMIDLSTETLKELVTSFIRKDFRKYFFTTSS